MVRSSKKPAAVLFFGPPGSGKSTQARAMGELPNLLHYDMGEALRRVDESTEVGRKIRAVTSEGRLLPDELVLEVFAADLEQLAAGGRYRPERDTLLLDGLPRTPGQADELSRRVDLMGVVEIAMTDRTELLDRLMRRGLENGRVDDVAPSVIEERLRQFDRESRPLLQDFRDERVHLVDGGKDPLDVLEEVVQAVLRLRSERGPAHRASSEARSAETRGGSPRGRQ